MFSGRIGLKSEYASQSEKPFAVFGIMLCALRFFTRKPMVINFSKISH
jgi:hypothetical protein